MSIFSRVFGSGPSKKQTIAGLEQSVANLTKSCDSYRTRLEQRIEQNKNLRTTTEKFKAQCKTQAKELNMMRVNDRRGLALERVDHFFTGKELSLPQESYKRFLKKCETNAPAKYEDFVKSMEDMQHRGFYEQLYSVEIDMAQGFDFKNLRPIIAFQRGSYDIELAKNKGITIDELKANMIQITKNRFDQYLGGDFIDPKRVDAICEIGAAWGSATRYMLNRYKPKTYHVYEIDTAWAQWLADNLGVDSKNCDGESLSDTGNETMDIALASSCLYFMPFVKQWNYLTEMARVLKPGGIALFNANIIERTTVHNLKGMLSNYFPRRSFGYIPQHCLDTAFPSNDFERLIDKPEDNDHYQIYRKKQACGTAVYCGRNH